MAQSTRKILIILAVVVLVLVIYFFLIYRPKSNEIANLYDELNKIKREKEEKEKIVADLDQFNREVEELKERLAEALAQLPNQKEIDQILDQLSGLIEDSGLYLETFAVNPEVPRQLYSEVPITLKITGNYHNIALFFDKASKLKRIINFSNLSLGGSREDRGETIINVECTATTFRFIKSSGQDQKEVKKPDADAPKKKKGRRRKPK